MKRDRSKRVARLGTVWSANPARTWPLKVALLAFCRTSAKIRATRPSRRATVLSNARGAQRAFSLPQFARIEHALQVASILKIHFIALALGCPAHSFRRSAVLQ